MNKDCQHGFSSPDLCPVCQHFAKICENEAVTREAASRAVRKAKDEQELARLDSDGPGE